MSKQFVIKQSYYFEAPPERVFRALTDSKDLVKWLLVKAEVDLRKGGDYSFENLLGTHWTGKVISLEKNKAVSFSWIANTTVMFEVTKKGDGTLLKLRHTGLEDPELFAKISQGWAYYLTNLKSVLDHDTDLRSKYDWKD
jgi:uncharacterized protein YndB with AHSA1/START domain